MTFAAAFHGPELVIQLLLETGLDVASKTT
jgi:hypothetical protein